MAEFPFSSLPDTLTDAVDDDDAWLAADHVSGSKTKRSRASTVAKIGGAVLKDGSVALEGDMDLGGNAITNVGDVDGRDVSVDGAALDAHVAATNPHSGSAAGPASSTDNAVARFDGAGGKTLQNSPVTITDTGSIVVPTNETVDGRDVSDDGAKLDGIEAGADVTSATSVADAGAVMDDDAPLTTQAVGSPGSTEPLVGNNNAGTTTLQFVDPAPPGEPADASEPYYLQLTSVTPAITENVVVIGRSGTSRTLAAPLQNDFSAGDADVAYAGLATLPTEQGLMPAAEHHRLEGVETGANRSVGNDTDGTIADVALAGSAGVSDLYARADHAHKSAPEIDIYAGTARTLADSDHHKLILTTDGTGPVVFTVPGLTVGVEVVINQAGEGEVQLVGDTGITLLYPDTISPVAARQFETLIVTMVSATSAVVRGGKVVAPYNPPRSESGTSVTVDGDDHDKIIELTNTGEIGVTFNEGTAGQYGTIILTGEAGTATVQTGTATVQVEEGFTTTSLAPGASTGVTLSYVYLTSTLVHVVGGLAAA